MRKLMESIGNVDSLSVPKTNKFGIITDISKPKVVESFEGFEESYDYEFNELANHLEKVSSLKKSLMGMISHAARSNPEDDSIDFKRQELENHIRFWLEEFSQIK